MIFKRITSFFISLLILVSSSGMAVNLHYCGDTFVGVSAAFVSEFDSNVSEPEGCCAVEDEKSSECCTNKAVDIKKIDQKITLKVTADIDWFNFPALEQFTSNNHETVALENKFTSYSCLPNAPPLYQLYCQYTFYA